MKVLVTGGAGYIGSMTVARLLESGHSVRVLDSLLHGGEPLLGVWSHPDFELVRGDIRDSATVESSLEGAQAVVHLAAIVGDPACARDSEEARSTNLEASHSLIDRCQAMGVERLVFASTCSNYGKMADPTAMVDEGSELRPVSLYAETKVAIERHLLEGSLDSLTATCLRFATIYGASPRMRFDLTVNHFTMELMTTGRLQVFGEQFWRPYLHVRDAARAIMNVLEQPAEQVSGRVFNVGANDQNFRKQDIVEMILERAPQVNVDYVHRDEDPRDYRVCFDRARDELGLVLSRSVEDGIEEIMRLHSSGVIDDFRAPRFRN